MKRILFFVCLSLMLFSCKTTKYNVREKSTSSVEIVKETKEVVTVQEEAVTTENSLQWIEELTTIIERIVTVRLSEPDSLKNQYPVEVTTTEREFTKEKTVQTDANSTTEQKAESRMQKSDNSKETINEEYEKTDKTTTKKTTPVWITVSAVILCIGILVIVFLILKKYRIL